MGSSVVITIAVLVVAAAEGAAGYNDRYNTECYRRVERRLRLQAYHVDRYESVQSLRECEDLCSRAFFSCRSFSYGDPRRERENCLLSREDSHNLNLRDDDDFYEDDDFDFYELGQGRDCDDDDYHHSNHGRGCYDLKKTRERIISRFIIRGRVSRTEDRRECEAKCDRERECKGFNYRFKTQGFDRHLDNCELSSRDTSQANRYDFVIDDDFDFYEKSRDGRSCNYGSSWGGSSSGSYRDECFRLAKTETTLERSLYREKIVADDIRDCEVECTRARRYTCRSFSFRYGGSSSSWDRENCYLYDLEYRELHNSDFVQDRSFDYYERRLYDRECGIDDHDDGRGNDITVTGLRCHHDRCRVEREGGYWRCELDDSGAWDYCCRPSDECSFSEGYELKWCYVGDEGRTQWRPCSGQGSSYRGYLKEDPPENGTMSWLDELEVVDLNVNDIQRRSTQGNGTGEEEEDFLPVNTEDPFGGLFNFFNLDDSDSNSIEKRSPRDFVISHKEEDSSSESD